MESIKKFSINYLLALFKKVINFNEVDIGINERIIEVDARTAYRFALCTQSFYLDEEYSGVYVKKTFSSFNMRNLDLSSGIYTFKDNFLHSLENHKLPDIFSGKKRIILKEGKFSSKIMSDVYNKLLNLYEDTSSYLLICADPNGSEWEQFYEFYLSEYFIAKNKITDIQIPWPYGGTPDFSYYQHEITSSIGGFLIPEICNLRFFLKQDTLIDISDNTLYDEIKIVEVKSSQKTSQAKKYLDKKITNAVYEFFPDGKKNNSPLGLFFLEDFELKEISQQHKKIYCEKDQEWFSNYLKINLLANFTTDEIAKLINVKNITYTILIDSLKKLTFNELIGAIKNGV